MYNAVNCAELQFDMLCISRILLISITTIIFDSMTLFDVTLRESTWTLFWSCTNHAYYLLIAVFLISLLPFALSVPSSVSFFIVRSKHTIYRIPLFPSHFRHTHQTVWPLYAQMTSQTYMMSCAHIKHIDFCLYKIL